MSELFKDITFAETSRFPFFKTLLSDLSFGQLPPFKPEERVATVYATPHSPNEVRIEYVSGRTRLNSFGEYPCRLVLDKTGQLKERTCKGTYEDGSHTLARGVGFTQAKRFLDHYPFRPAPVPTITLGPIQVDGRAPMPQASGVLLMQRATVVFEDCSLERQDR